MFWAHSVAQREIRSRERLMIRFIVASRGAGFTRIDSISETEWAQKIGAITGSKRGGHKISREGSGCQDEENCVVVEVDSLCVLRGVSFAHFAVRAFDRKARKEPRAQPEPTATDTTKLDQKSSLLRPANCGDRNESR